MAAIMTLNAMTTFAVADSFKVVPWNVVTYDPLSMCTTGADARFTIPSGKDGVWAFNFSMTWDSTSTYVAGDEILTGLSLNGSNLNGTFLIHRFYSTGSYNISTYSGRIIVPNLVAGNTIRAIVQALTNAKKTNTNALYAVRMEAIYLGNFSCPVSVDPGPANVRTGTAYTINDVAKVGTLDLPATTDVKTGVSYDGATKTGSYDGSDRWSDPSVENVRTGIGYKANSTTVNKNGTANIPAPSNVRSGTPVDATTGTLDLPTEANVKTGVTYDGSSKLGTYDGSDRWTDVGVANVRAGSSYKANSTTNNRTGLLEVPATTDVRAGVAVDAGVGSIVVPLPDTVLDGTVYDNGTVGTYTPPGDSTDPGVINVALGVSYKIDGVDKVGIRDVVTNVLTSASLEGQSTKGTLVGQTTKAVLKGD